MTRLTVFEIVGNPDDIVVTHAGPDSQGKYSGWITRGPGHNYKPLVSSKGSFDTPQAAEHAMREIVDWAKAFAEKELADSNNPLNALCESREGGVVGQIVEAAMG
jgi:hypothetical protein